MQAIIEQFRTNIDRVRAIHNLYVGLNVSGSTMDLTDLLRAEMVLIVSALDHFVHELTCKGMLQIWQGNRTVTPAFQKFTISLDTTMLLSKDRTIEIALETEIRKSHGWKSFQKPDNIADAIRLISPVELWNGVGAAIGMPAKDVKSRIDLIVDRRNKIAHEADVDPTYPGQRWAIDQSLTEDALNFIVRVCEAIFSLVA